jgi:hypothetical protein
VGAKRVWKEKGTRQRLSVCSGRRSVRLQACVQQEGDLCTWERALRTKGDLPLGVRALNIRASVAGKRASYMKRLVRSRACVVYGGNLLLLKRVLRSKKTCMATSVCRTGRRLVRPQACVKGTCVVTSVFWSVKKSVPRRACVVVDLLPRLEETFSVRRRAQTNSL